MNKKININPSSTKWLEKDDRVVADYFCDLGFRSLKQILDIILEIRAEAVPFPIHVGFRVNTVIGTHCAPSSLLNCSLLSKE